MRNGLTRWVAWGVAAIAAAGALVCAVASPARADATSYASDRRQIRACVLVSNASTTANGKENILPYLFYVMDRRVDLKPAGWEFINPLAPAQITGDIYLRWKTRGGAIDPAFQPNTPESSVFRIGAPLSKNMGAYWEVDLDTITADDLQQFDVAFIASRNGNISFSADERDKMRRFADSGGTLWIENDGGANINVNGPYVTELSFDVPVGAGTPQLNTSHHPLVNYPFTLSAYDVQFLGQSVQVALSSHRDPVHNQLVNPHFMAPIIVQANLPLISAGDFGAGHLVISSLPIGPGINSFVGGTNVVGGNSGAISGEVMLGVLPSDIKFAYNLVSWTSAIPTHGVNTRRTGGSRENIGSQLGRKWQTAPNSAVVPPGDGSGAVISKGVVFWVDGNNILHAYDASPEQDLDGDQNSDDGIPDLVFGTPYDEIWRVDLKNFVSATTRVSTPTIISANSSLTTPSPVDLVAVTCSNGVTLAFNAFPRNAAGRLLPTTTLASQVQDETGTDAAGQLVDERNFKIPGPSPAFSEGVLFTVIVDSNNSANNPWRVVAVDPLTGRSVFDNAPINGGVNGTSGPCPTDQYANLLGLSTVTGPLNVGYIRDTATGALDKMIYVQTAAFNNGANAIGGGQMVGCWFATKQEPLQAADNGALHFRYTPIGERARVPWFLPVNFNPALDLRPIVYVTHANGSVNRLVYNTDFTVTYEGSAPTRQMVVTLTTALPDTDKLFADYTVDWPDANITPVPGAQPANPQAQEMQRIVARRFTVPVPTQNTNFPIAGAAMSPEDIMVINSSDYPGTDKVYAVRDQYPTTALANANRAAKVAWAWGPNGPASGIDPQDAGIGINGIIPRLINTDDFGTPPAFANQLKQLVATDLELCGAPAISNGVTYEVGFCHLQPGNGGSVVFNAAIICALRTNPTNTFTIIQNGQPVKFDTTSAAQPALVTLEQIDLANSRPGNIRTLQLFEGVNLTVDRVSSSVTVNDFRTANNGDTFNSALPIYVRIGATRLTDPIVNANTGYGPLDNLLWWMIVPINPPAALQSAMPADLQNVSLDVQPNSGCTVVGDTLYFGTGFGEQNAGQAGVRAGSLVSVDLTGIQNSGGQTNVYRSDGTLRVHRQSAIMDPADPTGVQPIADNQIFCPPLATAGIIVVGSKRGLLALDNKLTLIADNNRIIELNAAAQAVRSIDATQAVSIQGGATLAATDGGQLVNTRIPLDRPSIARRTGLNDYLVCDTGNNRVVQMGPGGLVTWELHSLNNDLHFLRPGDPLTLNAPSDVQTYTDSSQNGAISITNPNTGVTYSRPAGYYYATHYVVADSGNFRGLEIVDVVDQTNTPITLSGSDGSTVKMLRQVIFVTRSLGEQNRNIRYRTMQQFISQDPNTQVLSTFMVAAVDNIRLGTLDPTTRPVGATSADTQGPGAGIMVISRNPPAPGKDGDVVAVINSFAFLDANGKVVVDSKGNVLRHSIAGPTYFHEIEDASFDTQGNATTVQKYLLADASGVYLLRPSTAADQTEGGKALAGKEALVEWMLTSDDYFMMTGRPLRAMSVQKLQDADPFTDGMGNVIGFKPRYLITNGYSGLDSVGRQFAPFFGSGAQIVLPGELHGEVFEVRSLDYYLHKSNNIFDGYQQKSTWLYTVDNPNNFANAVLIPNPASAITWLAPTETLPGRDANGNRLSKAIRRSIGSATGGTATYLLEQPTSASRPY